MNLALFTVKFNHNLDLVFLLLPVDYYSLVRIRIMQIIETPYIEHNFYLEKNRNQPKNVRSFVDSNFNLEINN